MRAYTYISPNQIISELYLSKTINEHIYEILYIGIVYKLLNELTH